MISVAGPVNISETDSFNVIKDLFDINSPDKNIIEYPWYLLVIYEDETEGVEVDEILTDFMKVNPTSFVHIGVKHPQVGSPGWVAMVCTNKNDIMMLKLSIGPGLV